MSAYFIAGTDTGVGKTLVAASLLHAAKGKGLSTAAIKPVAAGCEQTEEGLRNDDALMLQQHVSLDLCYDELNPVALAAAIAPHIAAEQEGRRLTVSRLVGFCRGVLAKRADFTVIEGAGGWRVPLNSVETMASLAKELNIPIIVVVGMRLGCINHALLTVEAIRRDGLPIAGWVANQLDSNMPVFEENIQTIQSVMGAEPLAVIPWRAGVEPAEVATCFNMTTLV